MTDQAYYFVCAYILNQEYIIIIDTFIKKSWNVLPGTVKFDGNFAGKSGSKEETITVWHSENAW